MDAYSQESYHVSIYMYANLDWANRLTSTLLACIALGGARWWY